MKRQDDSISVTAARKYQAIEKIDLFLACSILAQRFYEEKKKSIWFFCGHWWKEEREKEKKKEQ